MLYVAASDRLPITLAVSCRALSGPININNDHSDAMGVRDAGWLMLFAETNQEAYDNYLQAMRIGEAVGLPIMVCQDGFITSHAIENIELVEDEKVKAFVGEYKPQHYLLNKDEPMAVGAYATPVYYMEAKRQQAQAMMDAKDVIKKVGAEFGKLTGRSYDLIEKYEMDDAEEALVIIGSSAGTAKETVNQLRAQGKKVGLVKVRSFRPFPAEEIVEALKNVKAFAVMDKDDSFNGHCGPMFAEVTAELYAQGVSAPKGISYIYGLGGRDVRVESIQQVFGELADIAATGKTGETHRAYLDVPRGIRRRTVMSYNRKKNCKGRPPFRRPQNVRGLRLPPHRRADSAARAEPGGLRGGLLRHQLFEVSTFMPLHPRGRRRKLHPQCV